MTLTISDASWSSWLRCSDSATKKLSITLRSWLLFLLRADPFPSWPVFSLCWMKLPVLGIGNRPGRANWVHCSTLSKKMRWIKEKPKKICANHILAVCIFTSYFQVWDCSIYFGVCYSQDLSSVCFGTPLCWLCPKAGVPLPIETIRISHVETCEPCLPR